ncbi:MAG: hypothetical protein IPL32_15855 [Chloracidobacterium sp.]|nr:hypothetical protein [Chloracidobacterium sp.]
MRISNASSQPAVSRRLRFRSFLVSVAVLLLAVFTLFQTGERIVKADTNKLSAPPTLVSCDWLGTHWNAMEGPLTSIWIRRGTSNIFDGVATWGQPGTTVNTVYRQGNTITVFRRESSDGNDCDYTGTLSPDGLTVSGTYQCTLYQAYPSWSATISGCVTQSCAAPPAGMAAWWRAEGNAHDSVGTNNGTLLNGANFASGMVGQGFNLNGNTQFVEAPHSNTLSPTEALSIEGWIKVNALPSGNPWTVINKDNPDAGPYEIILFPDGRVLFGIYIGYAPGGGWHQLYSPPASIIPGTFVHVAGTFDAVAGQFCVYVNGTPTCNAIQGSMPVRFNTLKIGRNSFYGTYFNGLIDELSIYNRALSAVEIQSIHNAGSAGKCATGCGGPVSHGNAYDDTALVEAYPGPLETATPRTPVILIHGIHGNRHGEIDEVDPPNLLYPHYFKNLILSLNDSGDAYNNHFKTYKFHYVSDRHTTQEIAQALRDRIDEMCEFGNKEIIIVAHSMGGIVARHYMLEPARRGTYSNQLSGERILKLITLATPHHGTYGANGWARQEKFPTPDRENANNWFTLGDSKYWGGSGCAACALQRNTQLPNRGSLLWDNFDDHFTEDILNDLPWERHYDLPTSTVYDDRIIAYWGEISQNSEYWPPGLDDLNRSDAWDDARLAAAAYLIDSAKNGDFSVFNIPPPMNDGFVPVESAKFANANLMDSIHCPGYNHRNLRDGDGKDINNNDRIGYCYDGNTVEGTLFQSVRNRILKVFALGPPLLSGSASAGFGYQSYDNARPLGSLPIGTIDIPLSNLGDQPLQITSLSLVGNDPDQFVIINPPSLPLTVGALSSVYMTVGFNPTSPGQKTAQLRAENSSSNSVVIVNISATGVPEECDLDFSPASQFMPTNGGSGEVMVGNISCPWTVSVVDEWIHPTALADRVSFTVDANAAADVRYGTMIVSVYGRSYLYSISQDAANATCWLQMSSDQSVVQREAGNGSFYITAPGSCGWSFQSDSAWLVPSVTTLNGSGTVGFTAEANSGADRSGIITIQGSAMSAQFTVHQRGASITGTVTYGNAAAPPKYISNVTVTATGESNITTVTGAPGESAGQYQLAGFGAGSYTVALSKTTGQNGISSLDAARIAQHVSGAVFLTTDNQKASADVSNNGVISSFDAAQIATFVASGSSAGTAGQWKFFLPPGPTFPVGASPTSRTYPSIASNIIGDDYIGLLIGDVTGNWTPSAARPAAVRQLTVGSGPEKGIAVELPNVVSASDKEIVVPVNVDGIADKGVISYEFDLRYDPSVLQPSADVVDVSGTLSPGLSVVTNAAEPGLLRVVVYGAMPIDENGVLLNLRFTAIGAPGSGSPITFERIMFNEGDTQVSVADGLVEIVGN